MLNTLKNFLGLGPKVNYGELVKDGATILDVRTKGEYASGNIPGSVNIPVDVLNSKLKSLKKEKPVITCCASGMRSAAAKRILKANGFAEVHNGGAWVNLLHKL